MLTALFYPAAKIIERKSHQDSLKSRHMKKLLVGVLLLTVWTYTVFAGEKGWFGFGVAVKVEGFILNPTLSSVTVDTVEAHSPAAGKGIAIGDEITQLENTDVPGHKAWDLKALMQKSVGESLHLKLKRPNGEIYSVTLVAVKRP